MTDDNDTDIDRRTFLKKSAVGAFGFGGLTARVRQNALGRQDGEAKTVRTVRTVATVRTARTNSRCTPGGSYSRIPNASADNRNPRSATTPKVTSCRR